MIPKVHNVTTVILENQYAEQSAFTFVRVIFYHDLPYVFLQQFGFIKVLRAVYEKKVLRLIEPDHADIQEISSILENDLVNNEISPTCNEEYWVTGVSFNKTESQSQMNCEFKIASVEKPLDLLPYLIQTGAEHVLFSE
ncbi:hypothetical protein [Paenibacillus ferrarius]|uniref:hypothetical protein n=1 Tax=Paenibacillus ferrarius TaxID=1469647 RepID=UPI003D287849